jgi:DNA-binding transcriptional LysR family regulator
LLAAVRDAMRALEAGVNAITTTAFEGPVKISAPGPYATVFVLPALSRVRAEYPKIVPHVTSVSSSEVNSKLIAGEIDLAVIDDPTVDEHVTVYCLGELTFGVYCGETHPLAGVESLDVADVIEHPFVGPPPDLMDHWPKHIVRRLGMIASQMHVAVQACATGDFLVMLPDPIARAYRGETALLRLPLELVPPSTLYAVTSKLPDDSSRVELVLDAIGREVRDKGRAVPKASYIGELACDSEPAPPQSEGRVSRDSCVPAAKHAS